MPNPVRLTENFRNTKEIADVAEHFHRSAILPPGIVRRGPSGEKPRLVQIDKWSDAVARIVTRFKNRGGAIGVVVEARGDARCLHSAIKVGLPSDRVDLYTSDAGQGSESYIRLLDPGITVLTGESVIGLEFDAVFLLDLRRSLPCSTMAAHRRMYMLCARAQNSLILLDGPRQLTPLQTAALPDVSILVR